MSVDPSENSTMTAFKIAAGYDHNAAINYSMYPKF